jgi:hypothetical protein
MKHIASQVFANDKLEDNVPGDGVTGLLASYGGTNASFLLC